MEPPKTLVELVAAVHQLQPNQNIQQQHDEPPTEDHTHGDPTTEGHSRAQTHHFCLTSLVCLFRWMADIYR